MEPVDIDSSVFLGPGTGFTDALRPPCPRYAGCAVNTLVESYVSISAHVTVGAGLPIGWTYKFMLAP